MNRTKILILSTALILAYLFIATGCESPLQGLSDKKAEQAIKDLNPEADISKLEVRPTPIKGVYEVVANDSEGRYAIIYMSGDAKYMFNGELVDIEKKENLTMEKEFDINKVDFSSIPLSNSIILGSEDSANKVFVFSDPSCLPCAFYHEELKKVVREYDDIAVYLKIFALPDPQSNSYAKARAILCGKDNEESLSRLDALYAADTIPYPDCKDSSVDENMALASKLEITRSPTTVFPNGVKISQLMKADKFLEQLKKRGGKPVKPKQAENTSAAPDKDGPEKKANSN